MNKIILLILLSISFSYSQENSFLLKGYIESKDINVSGIDVTNINSGIRTFSDDSGYFEILVYIDDKVSFSAVNIKTRTIVITKNIIDNQNFIINIDGDINTLDEVSIKSHNLTGDLYFDSKKVHQIDFVLKNGADDFSSVWKEEMRPSSLSKEKDLLNRLSNSDPITSFNNEGVNILGGMSLLLELFSSEQ